MPLSTRELGVKSERLHVNDIEHGGHQEEFKTPALWGIRTEHNRCIWVDTSEGPDRTLGNRPH